MSSHFENEMLNFIKIRAKYHIFYLKFNNYEYICKNTMFVESKIYSDEDSLRIIKKNASIIISYKDGKIVKLTTKAGIDLALPHNMVSMADLNGLESEIDCWVFRH